MYPRLLIIITMLLLNSPCHAQDITGLWQGQLFNDSNQLTYRYEIAISENRGKLQGYSHTWFILDHKQYYGVKKVKVRQKDGMWIVEDDGLISNNYPVAPAKNIRQLNMLTYSETDSTQILSGPFTTNRTRQYAPLTGSIYLVKKKAYRESSLIPHLEELGRANDLSFTTPLPVETVKSTASEISAIPNRKSEENIKPDKQVTAKTKPEVPETKPRIPAGDAPLRNDVVQNQVYFTGDTLYLSLYDNGEVDGDTVSVLFNGEVILPSAALSTQAVTHSLPAHGVDSVYLLMYAENLGRIPPNTGLLVVRFGKELHEIRFSGNLNENAAIIFRRKQDHQKN